MDDDGAAERAAEQGWVDEIERAVLSETPEGRRHRGGVRHELRRVRLRHGPADPARGGRLRRRAAAPGERPRSDAARRRRLGRVPGRRSVRRRTATRAPRPTRTSAEAHAAPVTRPAGRAAPSPWWPWCWPWSPSVSRPRPSASSPGRWPTTSGVGAAALGIAVNAYLVVAASLALVGGRLGDRFGRRRIFGLGCAVFAVGSVAAALAPGIVLLDRRPGACRGSAPPCSSRHRSR